MCRETARISTERATTESLSTGRNSYTTCRSQTRTRTRRPETAAMVATAEAATTAAAAAISNGGRIKTKYTTHPSTHQPPHTPPGADPRGGRSPLAARIRHIDVSTQPNHVFEGQLRRQRVEQLAIRKAPVRHNGDFHPGRQHLPQPAQHLVLIAPLIALQRRGRHRLPQQRRRAPMASHHRQHDRVLPVGRKTGPIQRNDHLRAGADDERRPVCERSRRHKVRGVPGCLGAILAILPAAGATW